MADNELVVIISAQTARFESAMDRIAEKTNSLNETLKKMSEVAAVSFAAATAEIGLSVRAYAQQQEATDRLSQAFITQGIYSKQLVEAYEAQAQAIQDKTGIDKEAVIQGQTLLQGYIGQKTITNDLTKAIVDFATAQKMDLNSAFDLVGKSVAGQVNALGRYGVILNSSQSSSEKLASITQQLNTLFGGQAQASADGLSGSMRKLGAAFDDAQKVIGEKFAPYVKTAADGLTNLLKAVSGNKEMANFAVAALAATAAVTGATLAASLGGIAFLKLRAALLAAQVATNATSIAVKGLVGATGLGLLVVAAVEIYEHWGTIWPRMQAIFHGAATAITGDASALGKILSGIMHFDIGMIKEGMDDFRNALKQGFDEAVATTQAGNQQMVTDDEKALEARAAAQKKAADDRNRVRQDLENRRVAAAKAQQAVVLAEANQESKALIDIKKQEAETRAKIANEEYASVRSQLQRHLKDLQALEENQQKQDAKRHDTFNKQILKNTEAYQKLDANEQKQFLLQHQATLQASLDTEQSAREKYAQDELNYQIKQNNEFLYNQQKFGTAYAAIYEAMHSEIYQGTKKAFADLAQLQQSSNSTLKAIGKVAAIANVVIKTAESAMNIYEGFSTIPIVGPALGVAGAAAAVAFGAEQVSKINAANTGGIVPGYSGGANQDSTLSFLTPGELVVPRPNFDEVVNAVADQRNSAQATANSPSGNGQAAAVLSDIRDQLKSINAKFSSPTVINGDVLADNSYVDALVKKITDAVRYRNANLVAAKVGV